MEACNSLNLCIANTFFDQAPEFSVTCWAIGSKPLAPIPYRAFAQLDFCLIEQSWLSCVQDVYSDRLAACSSHHFLVISHLCIDIPKMPPRKHEAVPDHEACHKIDFALSFATEAHHWMQQLDANDLLDTTDPTY